MKMSMGRIGQRLLGFAVAGVALAAGGVAFAELGQPKPWEMTLQESATQVMDYITWFHNFLFVLITVITLFVLALLVYVVVKFNAKANPVPSKTTHNTLIEVAWTLIPVLILVGIAVPSFRLLFLQLDIPKADLTIDIAKGLTIVLVVILYANEWVDNDANTHIWLQHVVDWATPTRMPAFFLISGLLLSASIQREWRIFLDGKVVHFAYFYLLWLTILVCFEAPRTAAQHGWVEVAEDYFTSLVRPYSMLWFIYLLPIFFVVTKLLRSAPAAVVWTAAAVLQILGVETGVKVLDKFMPYYVFFYSGFVLAPKVFALARSASANRAVAVTALAGWAVLNTAALNAGLAQAPGVALLLGLLGGCALITACALLERTRAQVPLAYCGRNSLVIYLGFYIPLVIVGKLALSTLGEPSTAALLAVLGGVCAPLALQRLIRGTRFAFLFERPSWFSLTTRSRRQQAIASAT